MDDQQQKRKERLAKWKAEQAAKKAKKAPIKLSVPTKPRPRMSLDDTGLDEEPFKRQAALEAPELADIDLDAFLDSLDSGGTGAFEEAFGNESDSDEINQPAQDALDPLNYLRHVEKKNRKDIPKVDHSTVEYHEFRKSFYCQPEDLVLGDELEAVRGALGIVVKNDANRLAPVSDWEQLGLPQPIIQIINARSMPNPTQIQAQSLPIIMSGQDVIGIAPTGSGKTIAFVLPLLRQVLDQLPKITGVKAIVLSPTRELCLQTYHEVGEFARPLGISALGAAGGTPVKEQIDAIKRGVDIIVATPGRMIDLLAANGGRLLSVMETTFIVIDEADRMFDMGFAPQVKRILENVRSDRQSVVISATFPPTMERQVRQILSNPALVEVGTRSSVSKDVEQIIEIVPSEAKFLSLLKVLGGFFQDHNNSQAIVFVDRQDPADQLAGMLGTKGYKCRSLHGGHEQALRDETLSSFRKGGLPLLIATSVAARGLDVKGLDLVVNFDPPNHFEDYVHRVGRTGRAGAKGRAVTFLTTDQSRAAHDIVRALKLSQQSVPEDVAALAANFAPSEKRRRLVGFGGHGLERLDTERQEKRKAQLDDNDTPTPQPKAATSETSQTPSTISTPEPVVKTGPAPGIKGPATANFHTTLEINDYPQAARLAVTAFPNQSKIIESYSVSITNRGTFYPPGKDGPDKLYLAIEGPTEHAVSNAFHELASLLREGIDKSVKVGKYSV